MGREGSQAQRSARPLPPAPHSGSSMALMTHRLALADSLSSLSAQALIQQPADIPTIMTIDPQLEQDHTAQDFYGKQMLRSLNPVERFAVNARLMCHNGSLGRAYFAYSHKALPNHFKYAQHIGKIEAELQPCTAAENERRALGLTLPTNLKTDYPIHTDQHQTNKANREKNQRNAETNRANALLEVNLRAFIRTELKKLYQKNINPRDSQQFEKLSTAVLFKARDQHVAWTHRSDAAIAALLMLEQELLLAEKWGFVPADIKNTNDEEDQFGFGVDSLKKPSKPRDAYVVQNAAYEVPVPAGPNADDDGYLRPVKRTAGLPGAVEEETEEAVMYDMGDGKDAKITEADEEINHDYDLGTVADDDTDGQEHHSTSSSDDPSLEDHEYDSASAGPAYAKSTKPRTQQHQVVADNTGYLDVGAEAEPFEESAYDNTDEDQGAAAYADLDETKVGAAQSAPRVPRRKPSANTIAFTSEKPIPVNPFTKHGLADTLYTQLVRDVRRAIDGVTGRGGSEIPTLGNIVRDLTASLKAENKAAPEALAIEIVAGIVNTEIATPEFNYLRPQGVTDVAYETLFRMLHTLVSDYRDLFAAEEGSVPNQPKTRVLNDNLEKIQGFMQAFIPFYLKQMKESQQSGQPVQVQIIKTGEKDGSTVEKNFFVVVKRGLPSGDCQQHNYRLNIDAESGVASFAIVKAKSFTSYDYLDSAKQNPSSSESFGRDPTMFVYRDEGNKQYFVVDGVNIQPSQPALSGKLVSEEAANLIVNAAVQRAYNPLDPRTWFENVKRWPAQHPVATFAIGTAVVGGAAVGAAYAAGVFNAPPCGGYTNNLGACVEAELPDPDCSIQMGSTDVSEGGTVKLTPTCANSQGFTASSQSFIIKNIPAGATVTINGQSVAHAGGDFDVSQHIGEELTIKLPNGFNGAWTPQASVGFASGAKTFSGTASASQAVNIEPVAGTATVALVQGTFTELIENGNATFTMRWTPAPGDTGINKYVRNLALGDKLCWKNSNNATVCFESTAANNGAGKLNIPGSVTAITYVPKSGASGDRGFELFAKSLDGAVEGPASSVFTAQYDIQGRADVVQSINAPAVLYTVEGQASPAFNLTATAAPGDNLQKAVVLPPSSKLCGTLKSNGAPVCLSNTGASDQEFDITTWNDLVTYQGEEEFTFKARGEIDGSVSAWTSETVGVDQLGLPELVVMQNGTVTNKLFATEDIATQFELKPDFYNADSASVTLKFPTVTVDFPGNFTVNGTLANGVGVTAQVAPGGTLDVSGWRLDMPVTMLPPANVNRGNQGGDLNVDVKITSRAADGRAATVNEVLPVSVRPVADDFVFTGQGVIVKAVGGSATVFGVCQPSAGDVITKVRFTAPLSGTFFQIQQPRSNPNRFPPLIVNSDGTVDTTADVYNNFGLILEVPSDTPAPASKIVNVTAFGNDFGSERVQTLPLNLTVYKPSR